FSCSLNLAPCLRISPVRSSTSKVPKRTHRGDWSGSLMGRSTNARFHFTMRYGAGSDAPKHPPIGEARSRPHGTESRCGSAPLSYFLFRRRFLCFVSSEFATVWELATTLQNTLPWPGPV